MIPITLIVCVLVNTIFFFVLLINSIATNKNIQYESIIKAETAIMAIACTQYALTFIIENSNVLDKDSELFAQQLRYFDWLITTPLLLYTYWKLAELEGYKSEFMLLLFADLIMIITGVIAEFWGSKLLFVIGCLAYVYIIVKVLEIMNHFRNIGQENKRNLGWFFIFGWLIYPLGFYLNNELKFIAFSIADFVNKGIYSIMLSDCLK
jgi:bacteriorhodopsin